MTANTTNGLGNEMEGRSENKSTITGNLAIPNSMLQPMPEQHPMYRLIGRIVTEAAFHEHILDVIIWRLKGLTPAEGIRCTNNLSVDARYDTIIAQTNERGMTDLSKNFEDARSRSKAPTARRNRLVHDTWYADGRDFPAHQFQGVTLRRKPLEPSEIGWKPVAEAEMECLLKDLLECGMRAIDLFDEVKTALG
jgi:hypothetical protein